MLYVRLFFPLSQFIKPSCTHMLPIFHCRFFFFPFLFFSPANFHLLPSGHSPTRSRFVSAALNVVFQENPAKTRQSGWSVRTVIGSWAPPPPPQFMVRYPALGSAYLAPFAALCSYEIVVLFWEMTSRMQQWPVRPQHVFRIQRVGMMTSTGGAQFSRSALWSLSEYCRNGELFSAKLLFFNWWSVSSSAPWWTAVIHLSAAGSLVHMLFWFPQASWQHHEYLLALTPILNVSRLSLNSTCPTGRVAFQARYLANSRSAVNVSSSNWRRIMFPWSPLWLLILGFVTVSLLGGYYKNLKGFFVFPLKNTVYWDYK